MRLQETAFALSFVLIPEIDDLSIIMGLSTDTDVPRMITLNWVIVSRGCTSRCFLEAEIVRTDKQLPAWVAEIGMSENYHCSCLPSLVAPQDWKGHDKTTQGRPCRRGMSQTLPAFPNPPEMSR
ncbi:unnamed protein product [Fusarium graminearum]|nr:unnamed protein product [Fusarium graminearum]